MNRSGFFFALMILFTLASRAQNLFPNGGFENFNLCPTYTSQIERCTGWDSCLGTADFFHCNYYGYSTIGNYGIPATGSGVIGLASYVAGPWSASPDMFYGETFSCQLGAVLEPGATYRIKADMLYNTVQMPPPGPCLQLGFYFYKSTNPPLVPPGSLNYKPFKPQVGIDANLIPVAAYGTFTFNYTPDSCFDRVMIGVFSNDSTFGNTCYTTGGGTFYFDMDNVSMVQTAPAPQRITTAVSNVQAGCLNDCLDFTANSNLSVYSWNWSFPGAATPVSNLQNPAGICYPLNGDYDVRLITTYECSAETISLNKYIHIDSLPAVTISADSLLHCFGESLSLTANGNGNITWSSGENTASITVNKPGVYIAYNESSCGTATDTVSVQFENCPCTVYLPNAFTPDADGNNDLFSASGDCLLEEFQLDIYDRWGKRIFTASDISTAWDGKLNGELCQQGVYGVTLRYKGYSDYKLKKVQKSGYLVLVR